ncbi:MAG TPA: hypothetical protein VN641_11230 [Urbifossiella sp.]|nr:hypothetical protein [Urbifossiella sp.]
MSADEAPDFVYGVYLNLPEREQRTEELLQQHYVGSINFFGKTRVDAKAGHTHAAEGFTATFDGTAVVAGLQQAKKLDPDALTVTILPLQTRPPSVGAAEFMARGEESAKKAKVTYKRISVRVIPSEK